MIYTFIDSSDRTGDVDWNSAVLNDALEQRIDTISFTLFGGSRPSPYDDIKVYQGSEIVTVGADYVTVKDLYDFVSVFRVGDSIFVGIGTSDEAKYTISAIDTDTDKITFTTNLSGISVGEFVGHRIFGGNVLEIEDTNLHLLENIIYQVKCGDYTKLFDKGQIVDTFESRTARYIVNSICNDFINYNQAIDQLDYATNGEIQAVYTHSGVGNAPTTDSSSSYEGDYWGSFASSGSGTATWTGAVGSVNLGDFTGATSGSPTKGVIGFWIKHTDYTKITNYTFRIGSGGSDYMEITRTPAQLGITSNDPIYIEIDITDFSKTGTPIWTAIDYSLIQFVCTASTTVKIAGLRIMEDEHFKHYPYVLDGATFDDVNINYLKPIQVMQKLAKENAYFWYIDYEKNVHFFNQSTNISPFNIDGVLDNFFDLKISWDTKNLKNYQLILAGEDVSSSFYSEIKKGDDAAREWNLRSKFKSLEIWLDDNSDQHAAEAGTTTTNITITGHNLETGDCITNRTRSNTTREITKVDANNFTVEAITGQTNGDTISFFSTAQTAGIDGIVAETSVDYVHNSNAQAVRAGSNTTTLTTSDFIQLKYKERFPIITAAQNGASITAFKSDIGYTDGIFRGKVMKEPSIKSSSEALQLAGAEVEKYGNATVSASFKTHIYGLKSGQQINIQDITAGRNINQAFMIQQITARPKGGKYLEYNVMASSSLYGIIEFFQQLLKASSEIDIDENTVPINLIQNGEEIKVSDVVVESSKNSQSETVTVGESAATTVEAGPWKYGAAGVPQAVYNLCSYA